MQGAFTPTPSTTSVHVIEIIFLGFKVNFRNKHMLDVIFNQYIVLGLLFKMSFKIEETLLTLLIQNVLTLYTLKMTQKLEIHVYEGVVRI